MDPALDYIRPRGWRNSHVQQGMESPFQPSYQPIYYAFSPPPPIRPADSMPISYYNANGSYQNTPQYSGLHIAWNRNMDNYAPVSQRFQPGYYDTRYSMSPTQGRVYQPQDTHRPTTTTRKQKTRKDHQSSVTIKSLEAGSGINDPTAQYYGSKNEKAASYTVRLDPRHQSDASSDPPPDGA